MIIISPAASNDVDYSTRRLSELRSKTRGQNLKLGNRLLIELRSGAASDCIFVWLPVDQEVVVAGALTEYRGGVVAAHICLPVDDYAGHELHQVEVVATVRRHFPDLMRRDGRARGGRSGIQ